MVRGVTYAVFMVMSFLLRVQMMYPVPSISRTILFSSSGRQASSFPSAPIFTDEAFTLSRFCLVSKAEPWELHDAVGSTTSPFPTFLMVILNWISLGRVVCSTRSIATGAPWVPRETSLALHTGVILERV